MSEPSNFDALLAEIGTLAKAMPAGDDGKIAAAAGDAGVTVNPAPAGEDAAGDGDDEGAGGDDPMAKSFMLKLEDGTEVPAMDGAALIKSLTDRVEKNETTVLGAFNAILPLVKSLSEQVGKLSASAQPRRAVLTVAERPAAAAAPSAATPAGVSGEEFMAKAMAAQTAGRLNGHQVSMAEQYINAGQQPPADIVRAVLTP